MRRPCLAAIACCLCLTPMLLAPDGARANPPWPYEEFCDVFPQDNMAAPRIVGIPFGGAYPFPMALIEVHMYTESGLPMAGADLQIFFHGTCANDQLCWCPNGTYSGTTNAEGVVYFYIALGGCCQMPDAAMIRLDLGSGFYPLRIYDTVASPGFDGGYGPQNCDVTLTDFTYFANALLTGAGGCSDYDGDGTTALGDFVVFGETWGSSCSSTAAPPPAAGGFEPVRGW